MRAREGVMACAGLGLDKETLEKVGRGAGASTLGARGYGADGRYPPPHPVPLMRACVRQHDPAPTCPIARR